MNRHRRLAAVAVVLLVSACATPIRDQEAELAIAAVWCASPQQFPWVDVAVGQDVSLDLGPGSPVYVFAGERSHFSAVRLDGSGPRVLLVKSRFNGQTTEQYFHPIVTFYREDLSMMSRVATSVWQTTDSVLGPLYMRAEVQVPDTARYATLSTGDEVRDRWVTPPATPLNWAVSPVSVHTPAPTGRIDLTLLAGN